MSPLKWLIWAFAEAVSILGFLWTRNPFILASAIGWGIGAFMPEKWLYRLDKKMSGPSADNLLDMSGPCLNCGRFHVLGHERCET